MSEDKKTIQEALAEVQRKVNEERATKTKAEWEAVEEGTALVPYNAVKQTDWRTVSRVPKTTTPPPVPSSSSAIPKVAGAFGRVAGPIATGASIGGTASDLIGKVATGTETGRSIGKWIGDNVPGAKTAADAMRKTGEAIGVREPSQAKPAATAKPTELPKIDVPAKQTTPAPSQAKKTEPSSFSAAFKAAREKATEMGKPSTGQFEYKGKEYQTNIKGEKYVPMSQQTKVSTSSTTAPKPETSTTTSVATPAPKTPDTSATKPSETPVKDFVKNAMTGNYETPIKDAIKSKIEPEYESGKKDKKKMSEETNPLIASFLALQEKNPSNMFVEAKKLSKKQDEKLDVVDDDKIDAKDLAALRGKKKVEEESVDHLGSSTVTKEKKGYVDPSTPKVPYSELPKPGNAAGDVLSKAKNALDKTGVKEENESLFSEAELEHINSFFLEASVAPTRPEVAAEARPDKVNDGVSQNDVTGTAESGKRKVKEEVELDEKLTDEAKANIRTALSDKMKKTSGPVRSLIKLAKTNPANVKEENLEEGRPKKNPTPETTERDPRKHIQVEAGRAAAGSVVDFHHNDGSKSKITPAMGRRITSHLNSLKPADRQSAVNKMHDSAEGLKV